MEDRTFEWYRMLVDLGNFEVEHGRVRFYENSKLHLAFAAGSLSLASYAAASGQHVALVLALLVAVLGLLNAIAWLKQLRASSWWERRWRMATVELERLPEFRATVANSQFQAWSHDETVRTLESRHIQPGATGRLYRLAVWSWVVFHGSVAVICVLYGLVWYCSHCRTGV